MRSFKDAQGRTWDVEVSVPVQKRVFTLTGYDLFANSDGSIAATLQAKPWLVVDIAYAICKPQAEQRNITDEDFGRAMRGDPIADAIAAVVAETIDFFPNARRREVLTAAVGKQLEIQEAVINMAEAKLQKIDVAAEVKKLASTMDRQSSDTATNSQDSAESNSGTTPGES